MNTILKSWSSFIKVNKKLFILLLVTHCIFFSIKVSLGNFDLVDSQEYYSLAENIKNNFEFYSADLTTDVNFENYTKRPPVYSLFILIFSFLLNSKITVLIAQNILSILSIFISLKIFESNFKHINHKIVVVFLLTSVSQFIYPNFLMSEILFQFLMIVLCYLFHKLITTNNIYYLFYFQFIIILLFLTKPVFYVFIIPNIILCIWLTKYIKKAFLLAFIPIIACLLYMNWNYQRTGNFEFSSIQNINLKDYNLFYFHTSKYGEEYAWKIRKEITEQAITKATYKEQQNEIRKLSLNYIKKDWLSYMYVHCKGGLKMFIDPGRFDLYNFFEFENGNEVGFLKHYTQNGLSGAFNYFKTQPTIILIIIPIILLFNVLKFIGFVLFWIKNYRTVPKTYWFMLFILVYIVGLTGIIGASRFFITVLPFYLIFAALGFSKKEPLPTIA